jgi:hypothetical protein
MPQQHQLVGINLSWLEQALDLLDSIDEHAYASSPKGMEPHRAGGHLRHILEFYECFLDGLEYGRIDYDARRRDERIELYRAAAKEKIRHISRRLSSMPARSGDTPLFVRREDAGDVQDPWLVSSIARELQVLSSHTIHHFALIAMTLRLHGCPMDPAFGMAPSTLRFQSRGAREVAVSCAR